MEVNGKMALRSTSLAWYSATWVNWGPPAPSPAAQIPGTVLRRARSTRIAPRRRAHPEEQEEIEVEQEEEVLAEDLLDDEEL